MATVDATGVTPTTLETYQERIRDVFRAVLGSDANFDAGTTQETITGQIALELKRVDNELVSVFQAGNITRAVGQQLDGYGAALGIPRQTATRTTVSVTLGGAPGTIIPQGTRARTLAGSQFRLTASVQIEASGTTSGTMEAVNTGAITVGAGELTQVVDVVPGWDTITNAAAGATGVPLEGDPAYLRRYFRELSNNASSVLASMIARVDQVLNVVETAGAENDQNTPQTIDGIELSPHSVAIVVDGGLDADIAEAIRLSKTGGTGTNGTTTVDGYSFYRVQLVQLEITLNITTGNDFPGDGVAQIRQNILNYFDGTFTSGAGQFETDGLRINEDLHKFRLYTPINAVPGHTVNTFSLDLDGGGGDQETIATTLIQRVAITANNIVISVTP